MDLLEDWIGSRVQRALTEALDWKSQGSPAGQHGKEFSFENDGNSIRAKSSKKEYVQITKIVGESAKGVQLWISDSRTHLEVVIATEATERFEREERRRVTEETLGALIQIIDYDIVAQHHGPKRMKITMLIKNFRHVGSDGSTPFGFPRPVDSLEPIIKLLDQLQTLRAQEHPMIRSPASFKPARDHMPSPSQATSISSADDSLDRSQAMFATQVPGLQPRKRLREVSPKPTLAVGDSGSTRALVPDPAPTHEAEIISPNDSQHDLSISLEDDTKWNAHGNGTSHPTKRDGVLKTTSAVTEDPVAKRHNLLLLLASNNSKRPKQAQPEAIVKPFAQARQSSLSPTYTSLPVGKATPPTDLVPRRQSTPVTTVLAERHSESPLSTAKVNRITKPSQASTPSTKPFGAAQQPRKIRTRINGREIRIPKNQRDLLDRSESWFPPEPGHGPPTANVPISVLQELSNRAKEQVKWSRELLQSSTASDNLKHDRSSQRTSEAEEGDKRSTLSDEPISSAEWPPSSPERDLLPPESSIESIQGPDKEANERISPSTPNTTRSKDNSLSSKRRLSSVSLTSSTDMSDDSSARRRNPIRAARPSTAQLSSSRQPSRESDYAEEESNLRMTSKEAKSCLSKTSLLDFKKVRESAMNDRPPHVEELSHTSKIAARPLHTQPDESALQDNSPASDFQSSLNANQTGPSSTPSEMIRQSFATHNKCDEQSPKTSSPRPVREAEIHRNSASLRQLGISSSDSDSDLETVIPQGLDKGNNASLAYSTNHGQVSTAPNRSEPILQDNRTPYVHPCSPEQLDSSASPTKPNKVMPHGSKKVDTESRSMPDARLAVHILPAPHDSVSPRQSVDEVVEQPISSIEETNFPPTSIEAATTIPSAVVAVSGNMEGGVKRKASEPVVLSPNVTKRRKPFTNRAMSELRHRNHSADPGDIGRQHWYEFLARRKSETAQDNKTRPFNNLGILNSATEQSSVAGDSSKMQSCVAESRVFPAHVSADPILPESESKDSLGGDRAIPKDPQPNAPTQDIVEETHLEGAYEAALKRFRSDNAREPDTNMQDAISEDHDGLPNIQVSATAYLPEAQTRMVEPISSVPALVETTLSVPPVLAASQELRSHSKQVQSAEQSLVEGSAAPDKVDAVTESEAEKALSVNEPVLTRGLVAEESGLVQGGSITTAPQSDQEALQTKSEPSSITQPLSLFDRYKATYPDYPGNSAQFAAICKRIGSLFRQDRMEHPSLWDDFVARHRIEYAQYLIECYDEAVDPIPYERFYRSRILQIKFSCPTGLVVTPSSIAEFLPPDAPQQSDAKKKDESRTNEDQHRLRSSTEIDASLSSESATAAGRSLSLDSNANHNIRLTNVSETRRGIQNAEDANASKAKRSGKIPSVNSSTLYKRSGSPSLVDREGLLRSDTRSSTASSSAKKLSETPRDPEVIVKREVINLASDSDDQRASVKPKPSKSQPRAKEGRRSLPWKSPSQDKDARTPITPTPSLIHHPPPSPSTSKVASSKDPTGLFASFAKAISPPKTKRSIPARNTSLVAKPQEPETRASRATATTGAHSAKKSTEKRAILAGKPAKSSDQGAWTEDEHTPMKAFAKAYNSITPGKGNSYAREAVPAMRTSKRAKTAEEKSFDPFRWEL